MLGMRRVGKRIAQRLFVKPTQKDLRYTFVRRWARNDKQAYLQSMDAIMQWSVADRLGHIDVPTLLISSDEDYTQAPAQRAHRGSNAELTVVDDARHALPAEKPSAFHEVVDAFLTRLGQ